MVNSVANVVAGRPKATGGGYSAPLGTALPTDTSTALDAAFKSFGYLGDDGLVVTADRTTDTVKAWGGDTIKVVQTDFSATYQFTLVEELNSDALGEAYGADNVTVTAADATHGNQIAAQVKSTPLPHKVYVFEIADGDASKRICVPDGQVTAVGNVTYSDSTVVSRQITVTAYADENGVYAYEYTDDGQVAA